MDEKANDKKDDQNNEDDEISIDDFKSVPQRTYLNNDDNQLSAKGIPERSEDIAQPWDGFKSSISSPNYSNMRSKNETFQTLYHHSKN